MFLNCSTCFGRQTAHHQELKTIIAASGFTYVFGCRQLQRPATKNVCKPRGCNYSFEFLMMGGLSPETCWTIKKHRNNKFYYTVASCWFFLWDLFFFSRLNPTSWYHKFYYTVASCWFFLWDLFFFFHGWTVHLDTIESFIYPTDAQLDCSKNVKIYMRSAATCFGSSQPSSGRATICDLLKL